MVDGNRPGAAWRKQCIVCKPGPCSFFTQEFINSARPRDVYRRVAERANTDVLVTSDKLHKNVERLAKPKTVEGIILYKPPWGAVDSFLRHKTRTFREGLKVWDETYMGVLSWAPQFLKSFMVVSYLRLANDPQGVFQSICKHLELPVLEKIPDDLTSIPFHSMCGNEGMVKRSDVFVDTRWKNNLSKEQVNKILMDRFLMKTYNRLESLDGSGWM